MKSFKEYKQELNEKTAFIDPPNVLTLRRKAIRLFPGHQRVATYTNDNLGIEIAIPYTPDENKQVKASVVASEEVVNEISKKTIGSYLHKASDDLDDESYALGREHQKNSSSTPGEGRIQNRIDKRKTGMRVAIKRLTRESLDEAMSPELKKIRKDRGMFKRELARAEDHFDTSKQRLDWAKKALAGHVKNYGVVLNPIGECFIAMINEDSSTDSMFGEYLHKPSAEIEKQVAKHGDSVLHHFKAAAKHYNEGDYESANHHFMAFKRKMDEETMMESTIHSLHAITRTQYPSQVRFRDGTSAMIDHPTAAHIMKLHSKVNRQNKKRIEGLINSGAAGIKKVTDFAREHMK